MKNLLLLTQGFPFGESERGFLPTEFEALQQHFQVSVLAFGTDEPARYPLADQVSYDRYDWSAPINPLRLAAQLRHAEVRADLRQALRSRKPHFHKLAGRILTYSLRAEQILPQLRQLVKQRRIDILYTYWCVQATVAAIRLKREFPLLQVVTRLHGADLYLEQTQDDWQPLRPFVAKGCDWLVFVCQTGLDYFMNHWGREWQQKAMVSYIGSRALPRCEGSRPAGGPLVLMSCSSLIPIKRVSRIIEALALLPQAFPVDWHHLGDGELRPSLERQAIEMFAKQPHIHYTFHGHVPNLAVAQVYQEAGAQLLITTSETEGLPVSIMEAYSMGVPVMATAVGGIPEMLADGQSGFLLPPDPTPTDVAAALERFMSLSETERERLSQNALACWQAHFNAVANAENLMRTLCRGQRGEVDK